MHEEDDDDRTEEISTVSECDGESKKKSVRFCEDGSARQELDLTLDSGAADHDIGVKTLLRVPLTLKKRRPWKFRLLNTSLRGKPPWSTIHRFQWVKGEQQRSAGGVSRNTQRADMLLHGTSVKSAHTSSESEQNL